MNLLITLALLLSSAAAAPPLPTLSIMMPTNSRPEFVEFALTQIAAQTYPLDRIAEVVIIDDSPDELATPSLAPGMQRVGDLNVHYVRLAERASIGAKRNAAAALCTGDLVAHWDDDDAYDPARLLEQTRALAADCADVTVLALQRIYFADADELFDADMPWRGNSFGPHFGTLAYRRALLSAPGVAFPDTSEAEDYGFAQVSHESLVRIRARPSCRSRYRCETCRTSCRSRFRREAVRPSCRSRFCCEADSSPECPSNDYAACGRARGRAPRGHCGGRRRRAALRVRAPRLEHVAVERPPPPRHLQDERRDGRQRSARPVCRVRRDPARRRRRSACARDAPRRQRGAEPLR